MAASARASFSSRAPNLGWTEARAPPILLRIHAGPVGGVHLHRPQSRRDHQLRPGDLRADADLLPVPAQRLPGRVEPHRGRRSDCRRRRTRSTPHPACDSLRARSPRRCSPKSRRSSRSSTSACRRPPCRTSGCRTGA